MQAIGQMAVPGLAPERVAKPIEVHQVALREAEPLLFEAVIRRKAHDGTALGVAILLYIAVLAAGAWMAMEVQMGLATAAYCDGKCAEAKR